MSESIKGYAKSNVRMSKLVRELRDKVKSLEIEKQAAHDRIKELEIVLEWHHG